MTTPELTPMREQQIAQYLKRHRHPAYEGECCDVCRLILAYIEQTAMKEKAEFHGDHYLVKVLSGDTGNKYFRCFKCGDDEETPKTDERHDWTAADWIAAVKVRIGWKD